MKLSAQNAELKNLVKVKSVMEDISGDLLVDFPRDQIWNGEVCSLPYT